MWSDFTRKSLLFSKASARSRPVKSDSTNENQRSLASRKQPLTSDVSSTSQKKMAAVKHNSRVLPAQRSHSKPVQQRQQTKQKQSMETTIEEIEEEELQVEEGSETQRNTPMFQAPQQPRQQQYLPNRSSQYDPNHIGFAKKGLVPSLQETSTAKSRRTSASRMASAPVQQHPSAAGMVCGARNSKPPPSAYHPLSHSSDSGFQVLGEFVPDSSLQCCPNNADSGLSVHSTRRGVASARPEPSHHHPHKPCARSFQYSSFTQPVFDAQDDEIETYHPPSSQPFAYSCSQASHSVYHNTYEEEHDSDSGSSIGKQQGCYLSQQKCESHPLSSQPAASKLPQLPNRSFSRPTGKTAPSGTTSTRAENQTQAGAQQWRSKSDPSGNPERHLTTVEKCKTMLAKSTLRRTVEKNVLRPWMSACMNALLKGSSVMLTDSRRRNTSSLSQKESSSSDSFISGTVKPTKQKDWDENEQQIAKNRRSQRDKTPRRSSHTKPEENNNVELTPVSAPNAEFATPASPVQHYVTTQFARRESELAQPATAGDADPQGVSSGIRVTAHTHTEEKDIGEPFKGPVNNAVHGIQEADAKTDGSRSLPSPRQNQWSGSKRPRPHALAEKPRDHEVEEEEDDDRILKKKQVDRQTQPVGSPSVTPLSSIVAEHVDRFLQSSLTSMVRELVRVELKNVKDELLETSQMNEGVYLAGSKARREVVESEPDVLVFSKTTRVPGGVIDNATKVENTSAEDEKVLDTQFSGLSSLTDCFPNASQSQNRWLIPGTNKTELQDNESERPHVSSCKNISCQAPDSRAQKVTEAMGVANRERNSALLSPSALIVDRKSALGGGNISNQVTPLAANTVQVGEVGKHITSNTNEKDSHLTASLFSKRPNAASLGVSEIKQTSLQGSPRLPESGSVIPETAPETVPGTLPWPNDDNMKPINLDICNKENQSPRNSSNDLPKEECHDSLLVESGGHKLDKGSLLSSTVMIGGRKRYALRFTSATSDSANASPPAEEAGKGKVSASYGDQNRSGTNEITPCSAQNALKLGKRRRSKSKRDTEKSSSFEQDDDAFCFRNSPDAAHINVSFTKFPSLDESTKRIVSAGAGKPVRTRTYKKARVQQSRFGF